tara:strand:- start:652 stop:1074 length:423 start_codon:yes stop_codon:yes gene_type:complete
MNKKYIEDFKNVLKKENLKYTDQRFSIFKFLAGNNGHFECEEIIRKVNMKGIEVSRATAYRTLDILVKHNFARKLTLDDGIARYENKLGVKHHDHMIDVDSGEIIEFESPEIEKIQDDIAESKGYKIIKHVHQLFVKKIK